MKVIEVVAAVIFDSEDRILIARRGPTKSFAGQWEFPGGKVEKGEDHRTALRRELLEEMGFVADVTVWLGTNKHHYDNVTVNLHVYRSEYISGNLKLTAHDSIDWVSFDELGYFDFTEADIPLIPKCKPNKI